MSERKIVLASTSPWRRELLERAGLVFDVADPGDAEEGIASAGLEPGALALARAQAKGQAVVGQHPDALVIASDQVCALGSRVYGKPGSAVKHREQLRALAGRTHELLTAVVVMHGARTEAAIDVARLTMRAVGDEEIGTYCDGDLEAQACAGGYRLEAAGIRLFERIEAADHTGIVGLPLITTFRLLRAFGVS